MLTAALRLDLGPRRQTVLRRNEAQKDKFPTHPAHRARGRYLCPRLDCPAHPGPRRRATGDPTARGGEPRDRHLALEGHHGQGQRPSPGLTRGVPGIPAADERARGGGPGLQIDQYDRARRWSSIRQLRAIRNSSPPICTRSGRTRSRYSGAWSRPACRSRLSLGSRIFPPCSSPAPPMRPSASAP